MGKERDGSNTLQFKEQKFRDFKWYGQLKQLRSEGCGTLHSWIPVTDTAEYLSPLEAVLKL
jgi:hypothetical protein